ncbi:MAG TPA: hypothetical protein VGJ93_06065 [Desulfuromonadaceae bacterium]|jgi:hypothetical protein
MKLFKKSHMSEEARYSIRIVLIILVVPAIFFVLDFLLNLRPEPVVQVKKEKTVIVKEAQKQSAQQKIPSKEVVDSVREAIKNGNYSTAYMEINKAPQDSAEYQELSKMLAAEKQKKSPGIRKQASAAQETLHYYDEATPRNRESDWLFVYFTEQAGMFWPRMTIQLVVKHPVNITHFQIIADGKTFTIPAASIKTEKLKKNLAVWYDAPLDQKSFAAIQALTKARKGEVAYIGPGLTERRAISEAEKKGLGRIMEAYSAVGGNLSFMQPENTKRSHSRKD